MNWALFLGVPFTILNGKLAISGAQETATFVEVFEKIAGGELDAWKKFSLILWKLDNFEIK